MHYLFKFQMIQLKISNKMLFLAQKLTTYRI